MKRLVVLISIFLVVFFSLIYAFAQPSEPEFPPDMRRDIETPQARPERKSTKDTNEPAPDVNSVVDANDPNAVKAAYQMFAGLEGRLESLNETAEKETREWMRGRAEDRTNLAKAVEDQITKELTFIRKLAVEEKAAKTTAAIDGLLMMRKERFNTTLKNMEELKKREERRDRDRDDTERRRERPTRRRETPERRP